MNSCLDGKVKYGSALWDVLRYKSSQEKLDKIKPSLLKRVLQVPSATPSVAIQYEFGVNDLTIDILNASIIRNSCCLFRIGVLYKKFAFF